MRMDNDMRRFMEAYIEVPKKNGKSEVAAALGLYMMCGDGEKGAEVYCGASNENQAYILFNAARFMTDNNSEFKEAFNLVVAKQSIVRERDYSTFKPVIGKPKDGAKPSMAILDELHEQSDDTQYNIFRNGGASREQPLVLVITTAGFNTAGPCYAKHCEAQKVLEGDFTSEELFTTIYTIDPEDDWQDYENWKKANPNYGISCQDIFLRKQYDDAMREVRYQNANKCKHLNIWSNANEGWLNMVKWDANARPKMRMEDMIGYPCWGAVDLASRIDLAALVFLFRLPPDGPFGMFKNSTYALFGKFYLPSETVALSQNSHYRAWVAEGLLTGTPGARLDLDIVEADLKTAADTYQIRELCYDPYMAFDFIHNVEAWANFPCIEIKQSPAHISPPMMTMEAAILSGEFWHDGNSLLRWQFGNVIRRNSRNKLYYPGKEFNENKIDGPVAAMMALSRATAFDDSASIYETQRLDGWMG
jgi:phage terminase large subunit-like protein